MNVIQQDRPNLVVLSNGLRLFYKCLKYNSKAKIQSDNFFYEKVKVCTHRSIEMKTRVRTLVKTNIGRR